MRKRVEELARGKYNCGVPVVEFSVDKIEMELAPGQSFKGEFTIRSNNEVPIKGVICSANPRMECLTTTFWGHEATIVYEFHSEGLLEGDIQKGELYVICNQGEYNLSFVAVISEKHIQSSVGEINNVYSFIKLAKENWEEAKSLFYSKDFLRLFKDTDVKERLLYKGIVRGVASDKDMEEFLLAAKLKLGVEISVEEEQYTHYHVKTSMRKTVVLHKNTWGYTEFEVVSDCAFIEPEKKTISSVDFIGSTAELGYILHPEHMHAGKNFGCLILKNVQQEVVVHICASKEKEGAVRESNSPRIKKLHIDLLNIYVRYRLKQIVTGKWATDSCQLLEELSILQPENLWYRLMKAQAFVVNNQRQEAEWILSEFKRKCKDKKSPEWGYYLYVSTFLEKEEVCINRMIEEVLQIYLEHRENHMLFWCTLFIRKEYTLDRRGKLQALANRIAYGADSPLLYVESYCMFCQEPYLLTRLGDFELKVLNWARKQKMINAELAEQVFSVFSESQEYQRRVMLLLEACYEKCANEQTLGIICSFLIKNQKYGRRFFSWFEAGIQEKLRITGLYEAYLMSMDTRTIQEVPPIILMYFKYNNQLGYKQKSLLYVNIIANKDIQPQVYAQYRESMEGFAYEQMERGRIDDNLAVIYEEVVSRGIYSSALADALSNVLFVHKLTCFDQRASKVIVVQKQLNRPQIVSLVNGVAYFSLYSNDYCIFIEDTNGNRYGGSISYQLEKLMYPGKYLRACMQYSPQNIHCLLYYFASREAQKYFEDSDVEYFKAIMSDSSVSRRYQTMICPKYFHLLRRMGRSGEMAVEAERIDVSLLQPKERGYLIESLIEQKIFEKAYMLVEDYGIEMLSMEKRIPMLTGRIQRLGLAEDEVLLQYCEQVFASGYHNAIITEYLCKYYRGQLKTMIAIWKRAKQYDIEALELEERIIEQMLYTAKYIQETGAIYDSYEAKGNRILKEAYLTWFSFGAFCRQELLPEGFFEHLYRFVTEQKEVNSICELELLELYSKNPTRAKEDEKLVEELLRKYLFQGMYFAFYKRLGKELVMKYQLYDKFYIEYHQDTDKKVILHYKMQEDSDFIEEELTEMQQGVFVKQLVLFFGETVQYYISERDANGEEITGSGTISCSEVYEEKERNRYDMINSMRLSDMSEAKDKLGVQMKRYRYLREQTKAGFTIIE